MTPFEKTVYRLTGGRRRDIISAVIVVAVILGIALGLAELFASL